jgi:hypothetical protein
MTSLPNACRLLLAASLLAALAGCNCLPLDAPQTAQAAAFADASCDQTDLPSRGWTTRTLGYYNPCVEHPTLYLDQPYLPTTSDDGCFSTWDGDSALALIISPALFVGETIAMPVSAVCQFPWQTECSHGHLPAPPVAPVLPAPPVAMTAREPYASLPYPLDLDPAAPDIPEPACPPAP